MVGDRGVGRIYKFDSGLNFTVLFKISWKIAPTKPGCFSVVAPKADCQYKYSSTAVINGGIHYCFLGQTMIVEWSGTAESRMHVAAIFIIS